MSFALLLLCIFLCALLRTISRIIAWARGPRLAARQPGRGSVRPFHSPFNVCASRTRRHHSPMRSVGMMLYTGYQVSESKVTPGRCVSPGLYTAGSDKSLRTSRPENPGRVVRKTP